MLGRTQTIEKLKTTRQYLDEHYGLYSMTLFGSYMMQKKYELEYGGNFLKDLKFAFLYRTGTHSDLFKK